MKIWVLFLIVLGVAFLVAAGDDGDGDDPCGCD